MFEFKLPEVGENIKTGTVTQLYVKVGDQVTKDQELLELETDKASLPVPSPVSGTIKEILIKVGQEVDIGQVVMKIEAGKLTSTQKVSKSPSQTVANPPRTVVEKPAQTTTVKTPSRAGFVPKENEAIPSQTDVPAAPSIRRLARELGIELSQVPGSGPGGRVSKDDVKAYTKSIVTSITTGRVPVSSRPLPDFSKYGAIERQAMTKIRKVTSEQMSYSWTTIPHVTQCDKADITELEKLRKKLSTPEHKLTITPFILKIMASALKQFTQFNASIDLATHEIIYKKYYHLGVAVDTDRGLLVPKIRNVDQKNIYTLTDELNEAAERARNKKSSLEELQGGSMSLTNLGGIGGTMFTPIVNWPEVAILGVSRSRYEPVYENDTFVPRFMLPLSLSYDHRVIDGADGARFLRWICEALEKSSAKEFEV